MDRKLGEDLGVVYLERNINPEEFGYDSIISSIKAFNRYNDKVDFTNIEREYEQEQVTVYFKAVHVSEPTAATILHTKVIFKEA